MASASSSAARLLIRDGKSVASLLFRGRAAANLTENTGPAIRSLLLLNQTVVPSQYPVFSETFPVTQPVGFLLRSGGGCFGEKRENGNGSGKACGEQRGQLFRRRRRTF
ncbi:hypothetical protein HID58_069180 [Brassica napus]|uniref:Uncharacterized protein n=1 Tax=Brassica napus TaxID=3708 RepID=A0ABQ7XEY8_BRANA|nr:hypothetical protein HID58_069180 [Brassica napus]